MGSIAKITLLTLTALITAMLVSAKLDLSSMSDEMKQLAVNLHKKCINETEVEEDLVLKAADGILIKDEKLMCYVRCLLKRTKIKDGSVDYTRIKKILPSTSYDAFDKVIEVCGVPHENPESCERAYEFLTCYHSTEPEHFIMF